MDARDAGKLARSGPAAALAPQEREGEGEEERKRRYAAAGSGREEAPRVSRGGRRRRSHRALTRPKSDPSSTPQRWRRGKERGEGRPWAAPPPQVPPRRVPGGATGWGGETSGFFFVFFLLRREGPIYWKGNGFGATWAIWPSGSPPPFVADRTDEAILGDVDGGARAFARPCRKKCGCVRGPSIILRRFGRYMYFH